MESDTSKIKAVFYFKDTGSRFEIFSFKDGKEAKQDKKTIAKAMIRRLVYGKYKNKYITALIVDNETDSVLHKFVEGQKIF